MTAPARGNWRALAGKEARYLVVALRNGFLAGFLIVGGGAFLFCLSSLWNAQGLSDTRGVSTLVATGYALYVGSVAGAVAGIALLSWRAVRAWILVPLILIPATLWLVLWMSRGFLEAQVNDVFDALARAGRDHHWVMFDVDIGHAAHAGAVVMVFLMPLLLVDLGILALNPGVLWQLAILAGQVSLVFALGTIPGAVVSMAALAVAYVRGFRRRHGSG